MRLADDLQGSRSRCKELEEAQAGMLSELQSEREDKEKVGGA